MIDEQELNRKLAEWAGFKEANIKKHFYWEIGGNRMPKWKEPEHDCHIKLPKFTRSLDACFKWLVPKLKSGVTVYASTDGYSAYLGLHDYESEETKEPALALCLAIEKLIDGGNPELLGKKK